jgi:hypothetical protein
MVMLTIQNKSRKIKKPLTFILFGTSKNLGQFGTIFSILKIGVELDDGMSKFLTCFYINVA